MDSVSDRDYVIELLSALSTIMMHLSRFSEEVIIWNSNEYKFVSMLHCSERKAIRLLEELDEQKGLGLIKKKTQGGKKPNRLYLKPLAKVLKELKEK